MKEVNLERLKEIQLEILSVVDDYCKKNNINYFLDCGSLLGAIRHKGFIPWDDDIDIGMLREDYDKFIHSFNKDNDRYQCKSIENDKNFYFPYAKVLDTQTVLYEPNEKGFKLSINIDVVVYDSTPNNEKIIKRKFDRRDFYMRCYFLRAIRSLDDEVKSYSIIKKLIYPFLLLFPKNYFSKKAAKNSRFKSSPNDELVGNFMLVSRVVAEKSLFNEFIDVEFEGRKFKTIKNYDTWLRMFYGDYMELPPLEKRKSHHKFVAYEEN